MKRIYIGKLLWSQGQGYYLKTPAMLIDTQTMFEKFMGKDIEVTICDLKESRNEQRELALAGATV